MRRFSPCLFSSAAQLRQRLCWRRWTGRIRELRIGRHWAKGQLAKGHFGLLMAREGDQHRIIK